MALDMDELRSQVKNCRACRLCEGRHNTVFGVGSDRARVMLIGEAPGRNEDEQGEPFVGRAGQLLDRLMAAVDLSRETNVFIANTVKCRPPENRDPMPDEIAACMPFLKEQIRLISPAIIVCVGRISAQRFIDPDFRIMRQHGQFIQRDGVLMMGTIHPAALLRNPTQKPQAFADWIALRDKIREVCPETYQNG